MIVTTVYYGVVFILAYNIGDMGYRSYVNPMWNREFSGETENMPNMFFVLVTGEATNPVPVVISDWSKFFYDTQESIQLYSSTDRLPIYYPGLLVMESADLDDKELIRNGEGNSVDLTPEPIRGELHAIYFKSMTNNGECTVDITIYLDESNLRYVYRIDRDGKVYPIAFGAFTKRIAFLGVVWAVVFSVPFLVLATLVKRCITQCQLF